MTATSETVEASPPVRRGGSRRLPDLLLAVLANAAVLGAWALTTTAVMGSLSVARRAVMNSEYAFDTGRLPQPWVIAVGVVATFLAHRFFRWAMGRYAGGAPAFGAAFVAWCGVFLGIAWGVYNWPPPLQVGRKVGPSAGQSTPWTAVGWIAYYARLWLPALIALATLAVFFLGRRSPWRLAWRWLLTVGTGPRRPRRRRPGNENRRP